MIARIPYYYHILFAGSGAVVDALIAVYSQQVSMVCGMGRLISGVKSDSFAANNRVPILSFRRHQLFSFK